jgi:hypothetical protein
VIEFPRMPSEEKTLRVKLAIFWNKFKRYLPIPLIALLMALAGFGGFKAAEFWRDRTGTSGETENKYEGWSVYKSEKYNLGLRYPSDWTVSVVSVGLIVFRPPQEFAAKDHVILSVASGKGRSATACEKDQTKCSFYANDIWGTRATTPETEVVFFSHEDSDFTLTLNKYTTAADTLSSLVSTFEDMAASARFVNPPTSDESQNGQGS